MAEKILITGASGRLGRKLVKRLGSRVMTWDKDTDGVLPKITRLGERKIKKADVIVHLAANLGMFDPKCYRVNVEGTRRILEMIDREKKCKFIFSSSVDVERLFSDYAKSKLMAEKEIKKYGKINKNFDYLILRLGNIDFREKLVKVANNLFLRSLFGSYSLNLVKSDAVVEKIMTILNGRSLGKKIEKFYGEKLSANDLVAEKTVMNCLFSGAVVWLMRLTRRGGFYLYLSFQDKK